MPFVGGPERSVEPAEKDLAGVAVRVNVVESVTVDLSEGKILQHDHQDRHSQAVDVSGSHPVALPAFNLSWSVTPRASLVENHISKSLSVPKVDKGKATIIVEHQVVRLDVEMSESVIGMNIKDSRAQLLDKASLNLYTELEP